MNTVAQLINGKFVTSSSSQIIAVTNPANNQEISKLPFSSNDDMAKAIESASKAFKTWKKVPVSERARVMLKYQHLLKENHDEIYGVVIFSSFDKTRSKVGQVLILS